VVSKPILSRLALESYAREFIQTAVEDSMDDYLGVMEMFDVDNKEAVSIMDIAREAKIEVSW
jgi:hypothetical protein